MLSCISIFNYLLMYMLYITVICMVNLYDVVTRSVSNVLVMDL